MNGDNNTLWLVLLGFGILWFAFNFIGRLGRKKAVELLENGAVLLDVRTLGEYQGDPVVGSTHLSLQELGSKAESVLTDKAIPVICFCASGMRSKTAVGILKRKGYDAHNLGGAGAAKGLKG